jgi:flagellar basal-body rod protein FlgB
MQITGPETNLLVRLMSASTMRADVIANNISNQNTPGFKRKVVQFEDLLVQQFARGARGGDRTGVQAADLEPQVVTDELTPARADGNNVNMEQEMNSMRENRLIFETYAAILSNRMEVLRASIEESR